METLEHVLALPLFTINGAQTTVGVLLAVIGVALATLLIAHLTRNVVRRSVGRHGGNNEAIRVIGIVTQLAVWLIGFEIALHLLGIRLSSLFAASGFLALVGGFAAKDLAQNFLSGVTLRAEKIIRPGDLLIVNEKWIFVQNIGSRVTVAKTYDGEEVLIPNTMIVQSMVVNLTRSDRLHRISTQIGVSYDSDLKLVRQTLEETVDKLDWRWADEGPLILLTDFGASSVNYNIKVWIDDVGESGSRKSDLNEAIWWALKSKKITIAYPQLDVHLDPPPVEAAAKPE